jgi:pimeloyl-[acyl-carrier protein] methyl ester esterase
VLLAATPRFVKHDNWKHGLDAATTRAFRENFRKDPARTLERFIALQALGDHARTAVTHALRVNLADAGQHASALSHGLRLLEESDLRNALPSVSMRCLLIHGEQDALMPPSAAEWLAHRWSSCETFILPETGHAAFLSQPQLVAARIKQFIHAK